MIPGEEPGDSAKIKFLAEAVMGWRKDAGGGWWTAEGRLACWCGWNPMQFIEDAFTVQSKAVESHSKAALFSLRMNDAAHKGMAIIGTSRLHLFLITATPRQRMEAVLAAYGWSQSPDFHRPTPQPVVVEDFHRSAIEETV